MKSCIPIGSFYAVLAFAASAHAQAAPPSSAPLTLQLPNLQGPEQIVPALKILLLFTILTLAPAILISMTSFTRIIVVLSFVRQALGTQNVPPTQVMLSLSLLLTAVVMAPVANRINSEALEPYVAKQINETQALSQAKNVMSEFLTKQTREADLKLFYEMTHTAAPARVEDVAFHLLVPAFMISELRTGFEMGFLVFLPFILVDLIVASILTAMGMVMVPPMLLATPLKLLLFVLVDGWATLTRSLVASFA